MSDRRKIAKRVRYEVMRRDGHRCRYCGAAAPEATLTLDHVVPHVIGGGDEPSNLVTSCVDCNAGKASSAPDAPLVADVADKAFRYARALQIVAEERRAVHRAASGLLDQFDAVWTNWFYGSDKPRFYRDPDWDVSISRFYEAGLDLEDLTGFVRVAMLAKTVRSADHRWKYFCGCCWTEIKERQRLALELVDQQDAEDRGSNVVDLEWDGTIDPLEIPL
jgi:hypothetical protein